MPNETDGTLAGDLNYGLHNVFFTELFRGNFKLNLNQNYFEVYCVKEKCQFFRFRSDAWSRIHGASYYQLSLRKGTTQFKIQVQKLKIEIKS